MDLPEVPQIGDTIVLTDALADLNETAHLHVPVMVVDMPGSQLIYALPGSGLYRIHWKNYMIEIKGRKYG